MKPMREQQISRAGATELSARWVVTILVAIVLSCSGHGEKAPWEARTDLPDQAPNIYGKTVEQVAADTG